MLRTRWGQPQNLVMDGFADPSLDEDRGLPLVAAFGDRLIELSGWAVPDRWVGWGIARSDGGTALHLVAAVANHGPGTSVPTNLWESRLGKHQLDREAGSCDRLRK